MATYNFPYSLLQSCKSKFKAADMLLYFLVLSRSKLNQKLLFHVFTQKTQGEIRFLLNPSRKKTTCADVENPTVPGRTRASLCLGVLRRNEHVSCSPKQTLDISFMQGIVYRDLFRELLFLYREFLYRKNPGNLIQGYWMKYLVIQGQNISRKKMDYTPGSTIIAGHQFTII